MPAVSITTRMFIATIMVMNTTDSTNTGTVVKTSMAVPEREENAVSEKKLSKYNFDEIIDRKHTNAMSTDGFRSYIFMRTNT